MMENTKTNISITNKDGKIMDFDVLCTFDSHITSKSYMIYTDSSEHYINVYYACYDKNNFSQLQPIKTQEELILMDNIFSSIEHELKDKFCKPFIVND